MEMDDVSSNRNFGSSVGLLPTIRKDPVTVEKLKAIDILIEKFNKLVEKSG